MKLLPLPAVFLISCAVMGVQAGKRLGIYKKWPACKKDYEYVFLVKNSDRIPGERYNERRNKNGKTLWYVCQPCTQCASGVRQLRPCSTHHDTDCSATQCAVAECVLDDNFHACRLPGDPEEFPSVSAMMDPCDPSKISVDPATPIPATEDLLNGPSLKQLKNSSASLSKNQMNAPAADAQQNSVSNESNLAETSGFKLGTLETVLLTVSLGVVLISVIVVMVVFIYYRASKRRVPNGSGDSSSSEREVLETTI